MSSSMVRATLIALAGCESLFRGSISQPSQRHRGHVVRNAAVNDHKGLAGLAVALLMGSIEEDLERGQSRPGLRRGPQGHNVQAPNGRRHFPALFDFPMAAFAMVTLIVVVRLGIHIRLAAVVLCALVLTGLLPLIALTLSPTLLRTGARMCELLRRLPAAPALTQELFRAVPRIRMVLRRS